MNLKKYKIPVIWQMIADVEVEASSLEEAIKKVQKGSLPEGTYLPESFEVQRDFIEEEDEEINEWVEIEESTWEQKLDEDTRKVVKALYHLDEIKIVETVYVGSKETSNKVVLVTESNYDGNQFMLANYGIEIEFGN